MAKGTQGCQHRPAAWPRNPLFKLPLARGAGGKPKRRSYAREGVGSVQGSIHSASSQDCRRISPDRHGYLRKPKVLS